MERVQFSLVNLAAEVSSGNGVAFGWEIVGVGRCCRNKDREAGSRQRKTAMRFGRI